MTERFELKMEENKWYFYDNVEEDYIYSKHSVCRLLNHLHHENHSLKFQLDECANNKLYSRRKLEEENKQLRQQVANYELAKRNLIKRLDDREKEDFERFFK